MLIAIDARPAEREGYGIARYSIELINQLMKIDRENRYALLVNTDQLSSTVANHSNFSLYKIRSKWKGLAEQIELPLALARIKPDLFHATSFVVPYFMACPTVFSLLDLIQIHFPDDYTWLQKLYYRLVIGKAVKQARRIITISQYSKQDICRQFGVKDSLIKVTYLAAADNFTLMPEANDKAELCRAKGLPYPFILTVGNQRIHKNLSQAIRAFIELKKRYNIPHKLVVVSRIGSAIEKLIQSTTFARDIICQTKLDNNQMKLLYNAAEIFLFPSKCEGFGLPPLEAMACGTPVICSSATSLPEIIGQAGILVSPDDLEALICAMQQLINQPEQRKNYSRLGLLRAKEFSWERCARETLSLYEEVVRGGKMSSVLTSSR